MYFWQQTIPMMKVEKVKGIKIWEVTNCPLLKSEQHKYIKLKTFLDKIFKVRNACFFQNRKKSVILRKSVSDSKKYYLCKLEEMHKIWTLCICTAETTNIWSVTHLCSHKPLKVGLSSCKPFLFLLMKII